MLPMPSHKLKLGGGGMVHPAEMQRKIFLLSSKLLLLFSSLNWKEKEHNEILHMIHSILFFFSILSTSISGLGVKLLIFKETKKKVLSYT